MRACNSEEKGGATMTRACKVGGLHFLVQVGIKKLSTCCWLVKSFVFLLQHILNLFFVHILHSCYCFSSLSIRFNFVLFISI